MSWHKLISDICDFGYTQPQIAARCGCGQTTISDLFVLKSKEPRHSLGEKLIAMLAELQADEKEEAEAEERERKTGKKPAAAPLLHIKAPPIATKSMTAN